MPDTVPLPFAFEAVSVIVIAPENDDPDCVICHRIVPGPDESDAFPAQVPLRLADGAFGDDESPPHDDIRIVRTITAQRFIAWDKSV